jgi:hypothetical protein
MLPLTYQNWSKLCILPFCAGLSCLTLSLMTDTTSPHQWSPIPAQSTDLGHTSELRWTHSAYRLRIRVLPAYRTHWRDHTGKYSSIVLFLCLSLTEDNRAEHTTVIKNRKALRRALIVCNCQTEYCMMVLTGIQDWDQLLSASKPHI